MNADAGLALSPEPMVKTRNHFPVPRQEAPEEIVVPEFSINGTIGCDDLPEGPLQTVAGCASLTRLNVVTAGQKSPMLYGNLGFVAPNCACLKIAGQASYVDVVWADVGTIGCLRRAQ